MSFSFVASLDRERTLSLSFYQAKLLGQKKIDEMHDSRHNNRVLCVIKFCFTTFISSEVAFRITKLINTQHKL